MNERCGNSVRNRARRATKPDDTGPNQSDLEFCWPRPFLEPDPELETTQRLQIQSGRPARSFGDVHYYSLRFLEQASSGDLSSCNVRYGKNRQSEKN